MPRHGFSLVAASMLAVLGISAPAGAIPDAPCASTLACAGGPLPLAAAGEPLGPEFPPGEVAALHEYMAGLPQRDAAGIWVCPPLPASKRLLAALKYADDEARVRVPGLHHGVRTLPAVWLRYAYCIGPKPGREEGPAAMRDWLRKYFATARPQPMPQRSI